MKTPLVLVLLLAVASVSLLAAREEQPGKIDTLYIQPHQADDLPEAVAAWLEARDYVIPIADEAGYREMYFNRLKGSFIKPGQEDCVVLTIKSANKMGKLMLWVFPAGDTLSPMEVDGRHNQSGLRWYPPWDGLVSPMTFAWRIRPYGPEHMENLRQRGTPEDSIPEITHMGIHLQVLEKGGGYYYYNAGDQWKEIPGVE